MVVDELALELAELVIVIVDIVECVEYPLFPVTVTSYLPGVPEQSRVAVLAPPFVKAVGDTVQEIFGDEDTVSVTVVWKPPNLWMVIVEVW